MRLSSADAHISQIVGAIVMKFYAEQVFLINLIATTISANGFYEACLIFINIISLCLSINGNITYQFVILCNSPLIQVGNG